jgi:hypothetical protein
MRRRSWPTFDQLIMNRGPATSCFCRTDQAHGASWTERLPRRPHRPGTCYLSSCSAPRPATERQALDRSRVARCSRRLTRSGHSASGRRHALCFGCCGQGRRGHPQRPGDPAEAALAGSPSGRPGSTASPRRGRLPPGWRASCSGAAGNTLGENPDSASVRFSPAVTARRARSAVRGGLPRNG